MAALLSIFFTGYLIYGIVRFCSNAEVRKSFWVEMLDDPLKSIFALVMLLSWMMFFWGVMIPSFGMLPLLDTGLNVWQAGGIGSLVCFTLMMTTKRFGF